jgi:hypothetical protein
VPPRAQEQIDIRELTIKRPWIGMEPGNLKSIPHGDAQPTEATMRPHAFRNGQTEGAFGPENSLLKVHYRASGDDMVLGKRIEDGSARCSLTASAGLWGGGV